MPLRVGRRDASLDSQAGSGAKRLLLIADPRCKNPSGRGKWRLSRRNCHIPKNHHSQYDRTVFFMQDEANLSHASRYPWREKKNRHQRTKISYRYEATERNGHGRESSIQMGALAHPGA